MSRFRELGERGSEVIVLIEWFHYIKYSIRNFSLSLLFWRRSFFLLYACFYNSLFTFRSFPAGKNRTCYTIDWMESLLVCILKLKYPPPLLYRKACMHCSLYTLQDCKFFGEICNNNIFGGIEEKQFGNLKRIKDCAVTNKFKVDCFKSQIPSSIITFIVSA